MLMIAGLFLHAYNSGPRKLKRTGSLYNQKWDRSIIRSHQIWLFNRTYRNMISFYMNQIN